MKSSLRNQYFGWLLLLILIHYVFIFSSFFFIELYESHSQKTPFTDEYTELISVLLIMLITLPAGLYVAWTITERLLKPLRRILETANHISRGRLDERIPSLDNSDELSRLSATINEAFDRYAMAVQRLEHFSSDASHQLRTPLAAIQSAAEVSLQNERSISVYKETLGDILEQTQKLNRTIDQLLKLSKLDISMKESFQQLDLARLLQEETSEANEVLDECSVSFHADAGSNYTILANETLLKEAFNNLLNNAVAAISPDGTIAMSVTAKGTDLIEWRFEDSGIGISEEDRNRVFDRFYRGRTSSYAGSGLGLSIVKEIILLHDGTIHVEKSPRLGGAVFSIILPVAKNVTH